MSSQPHVPPAIFEHRDSHSQYVKQYQRGKPLGHGGFATVFKCQSIDSKRIYACKVIDKRTLKKKQLQQKLVTEIKLHRNLSHKNIIQFERFFEDRQWVYIILEICTNGSLMDVMRRRKRLTEPESAFYFKQIVIAVQYLHNQKVIHRDLKLGNILLDSNMDIKLCDFGLAAKLDYDDQRKTTICGTPNYIAPEILLGRHNGGHSYEVDIWSLGVILFTLLCGKPPFETKHIESTYRRIRHLNYSFPSGIKMSGPCKHLIQSLLVIDASQRSTLSDILQHSFLSQLPIPKSLPISCKHKEPTMSELFPEENAPQLDLPVIPPPAVNAVLKENVNIKQNPIQKQQQNTKKLNLKPKNNKSLAEVVHDTSNISEENKILQPKNQTSFCFTASISPSTKAIAAPAPPAPAPVPAPSLIPNSNSNSSSQNSSQNSSATSMNSSSEDCVRSKYQASMVQNSCVFIVDWVDYSKRYGMGYICNNGHTGIYFNDGTKILAKTDQTISYISNGKTQRFTKDEYPSTLAKKLILLKHFESYLQSKLDDKQRKVINDYQAANQEQYLLENIYLKNWTNTQHATLFRLSNKTIQIDFNDQSRIIICSRSQHVIYTNKTQQQKIILLSDVLQTRQKDLRKRMRYMQDILKHLLGVD